MPVSDHRDIPYVRAFINLHRLIPSSEATNLTHWNLTAQLWKGSFRASGVNHWPCGADILVRHMSGSVRTRSMVRQGKGSIYQGQRHRPWTRVSDPHDPLPSKCVALPSFPPPPPFAPFSPLS